MRKFRRLLAKSSTTPENPKTAERLSGHTAAVLAAADELLEARLDASLVASGLAIGEWRERVQRIVRLAALIHDLGKANDQFQSMVRHDRAARQAMRHEAVSLWLCWPDQPLAGWLRPAVLTDDDYVCAVIAAAGHHRKFWNSAFADEHGAGTELVVLTSHEDFANTLKLGNELALAAPPAFVDDLRLIFDRRSHPKQKFSDWEIASDRLKRGAASRVLGVAKALTLAADVAGSCLPKSGERAGWIKEQLAARSNANAISELVNQRLKGVPPRAFQLEVASRRALVTLVRAGCGSGKTAAAYLWAQTQHPQRRLWVTYPTTGTATEGFRDYLVGAGLESRLEHGRAAVDMDVLGLADGQGTTRERDRLDAIRAWGCDAVACTVDTVLGIIQNHRKSMYAWPALANAAVVFDEIHAYDQSLFDALLHFLMAFPGIPALLMTASLPEPRLQRLRRVVKDVHQRDLVEIAGPEPLENLPRYHLKLADDPWGVVEAALANHKKVLWVSNTVSRCIENADQALARGLAPLVYHSRFRYCDRVKRHEAVIDAFDPSRTPGSALALTTQVAEMSLDLSADLLVTDLAPVPSLIQRLGRLNRRSNPDDPAPVMPFVVLPFDGEPYKDGDLPGARLWLEGLRDRDLSQRDLINGWKPRIEEASALTPSTFRQGGFTTIVGDLREASPGITVLLQDDAARVRRGEAPSIELALPMNIDRSKDFSSWPMVDFYPVAPANAITYDRERGGRWRKA